MESYFWNRSTDRDKSAIFGLPFGHLQTNVNIVKLIFYASNIFPQRSQVVFLLLCVFNMINISGRVFTSIFCFAFMLAAIWRALFFFGLAFGHVKNNKKFFSAYYLFLVHFPIRFYSVLCLLLMRVFTSIFGLAFMLLPYLAHCLGVSVDSWASWRMVVRRAPSSDLLQNLQKEIH